jgi:phage FluMu protein Com
VINTQRPPELYLPIDFSNWLPGTVSTNFNELEIWAMSYYDEIVLRNPDGLMNGKAVADVMQRCIPAISNPWQIPENSYRYIMIAINLATYGNKTNFGIKCNHCKEKNEYEIDLQRILSEFNYNQNKEFSIDNMTFSLDDATYYDIVTYRNNNYGLLKSISSIQKNPENSFDVKKLKTELSRYRKNEIWLKSKRIKRISIDGYEPFESESQIINLLENFNKKTMHDIDQNLSFYKTYQTKKIKCAECGSVNSIDINLDPSDHFFNKAVDASDEELESVFNEMDSEVKFIQREIAKIIWFMRGSVSYAECMKMSPGERSSLAAQIQENLDFAKKNNLPIF